MNERVFNNRYRIERRIGEGGMAIVYSGTDVLLRRRVAIKVLREQYAADEDFVRRFYYEAQAAARLSHPNIVNTYDVGREDDTYFIVMELIDGTTLAELISTEQNIPEPVTIDFAAQICNGLAYAHRQGLLHRDIKPANILITKDDVVKLSDFGIARAVSQHSLAVTQPGMVMGSVFYLSPEQAQGHDLNEASDLYSVGVVLYQMLTGKLPYTGDSPITVALKHISGPLPELDPERLHVSPALTGIIRRLLQKSPADRYASASEVASALREAREHPTAVFAAVSHKSGPAEAPTVQIPVVPQPPPRRSQAPDRQNGRGAETGTSGAVVDERTVTNPLVWLALALVLLAAGFGGYTIVQRAILPLATPAPLLLATYVGQSASVAKEALSGLGLKAKITLVTSNSVPPDRVVRQLPEAGQAVPPGDTVELFVSSGLPLLEVPNVKSFSAEDAQKVLTGAKFTVKTVGRYDAKVAAGSVIDQQPAPTKKLRQGAVVTLFVSKGPAPVVVPNVVSLKVDSARALLAKAGLKLTVGDTQDSDNIPPNTVASQDPKDGTQVGSGTAVTVTVSAGPGLTAVPGVGGQSMNEATTALKNAGFAVVYSWRVVPGATGNVIAQNPTPDQRARRGSAVTLVVGVNGTVPDVAGMTIDDAKNALLNAGYTVGNIALTQEGEEGKVVRTEPESNTALRPGDNNAITIYYNQPGPR